MSTPFCQRGDCTHSDIPHLVGECVSAHAIQRGGKIATTRRRELPDRRAVTAKAELTWLAGNERPYFSVTGEELDLRRRGDNRVEACGCLHEMVAENWPELAPVIRVHLSDDDGTPMHAAANALHWLGFSTWGKGKPMAPDGDYGRRELETDERGLTWAPVAAANHLRISVERVRELRERINAASRAPWTTETVGAARARVMADICAELAPAWKAEADEALRIIRGES